MMINLIIAIFSAILLLLNWATNERGFQVAIFSLLPSIPLGAGLSTVAVTTYCWLANDSACGFLIYFTFPFAVVLTYIIILLKLYSTSVFKPFFGFILGVTIVLVISGDYHAYQTTHVVTVSSSLVLVTAIIGGFLGAYISTSNHNPLTAKLIQTKEIK